MKRRGAVLLTSAALYAPIAVGAAGCAHKPAAPCETPPPFHLSIVAAQKLNPDARGGSLPTQVRVLQLRAVNKLQAVQFEQLWQKPEIALGDEWVGSDDLALDPGQSLPVWLARRPRSDHVVVLGLFRQPGSHWMAVAQLPPVSEDRCVPQKRPRIGPPRPDDAHLRFLLEGSNVTVIDSSKPTGRE